MWLRLRVKILMRLRRLQLRLWLRLLPYCQSTVDLITVFSPYKDTVTISCAKKNSTVVTHNITGGLTNVQLPPNCKAVTNEMVIFAPQGTEHTIIKLSAITWDMTDNLLTLADSLETVHGMNVTELETSFARYPGKQKETSN
jgi:hypothetical protein